MEPPMNAWRAEKASKGWAVFRDLPDGGLISYRLPGAAKTLLFPDEQQAGLWAAALNELRSDRDAKPTARDRSSVPAS